MIPVELEATGIEGAGYWRDADDAERADTRPAAELCACGRTKHPDTEACDDCGETLPRCPRCDGIVYDEARCAFCGRHG